MTLLAGGWFENWETMGGAAVFILYILGSIIGGKKKTPPQPGAPRSAPTPPRQAPRPPRQAPPPLSPGSSGQSGPPRPPRAPRTSPMVSHAPPATSTLRPAEMRKQLEQQTHRDMPPPAARPLMTPPPPRVPTPPMRRPAPPRPAPIDDEPPRRRPAQLGENESALAAHRPREVALPSEIAEERSLHVVPQEIEEERKAHRLLRDPDAAARRGEELREKLIKVLRSRNGLRGAVMLSEIISPPLALRESHLS